MHIEEQVLSFKMVGHMWKSVKKCLKKWARNELKNFLIISDYIPLGQNLTIIVWLITITIVATW